MGYFAGFQTVNSCCHSQLECHYSLCSKKEWEPGFRVVRNSSFSEPEVEVCSALKGSGFPSERGICRTQLNTMCIQHPRAKTVISARSVLELPGMPGKYSYLQASKNHVYSFPWLL